MSGWFPNLHKLFSGKIGSENDSHSKSQKITTGYNIGAIAQDHGTAINAGTVHVHMIQPDSEIKEFTLSGVERKVLFALAEGAELRGIRDSTAKISDAFVFGNDSTDEIDREGLPDIISSLFRKGLIDKEQNNALHFIISNAGRRVVQRMDLDNTKESYE